MRGGSEASASRRKTPLVLLRQGVQRNARAADGLAGFEERAVGRTIVDEDDLGRDSGALHCDSQMFETTTDPSLAVVNRDDDRQFRRAWSDRRVGRHSAVIFMGGHRRGADARPSGIDVDVTRPSFDCIDRSSLN